MMVKWAMARDMHSYICTAEKLYIRRSISSESSMALNLVGKAMADCPP